MTSPRVSVVVPTYNNGSFIEATMESILAQTFTDFELLVSDHESTDDTWERLQRFAFDPRVTLWQTPQGGGAPANWQAVTARARGEFVKLVCGDDLIYPTCLSDQVVAMDAHPGATLVCGRRDLIDAHGAVLPLGRGTARLRGLVPGRDALRRTVRAGTNVFGEPATVLMRTAVLREVGGWWGEFPYVIDEATYALVLLRGDVYAVDLAIAAFRVSDGQWSVDLASNQAAQVIAFHDALAARAPDVLSKADLRRGAVMARALGHARRLVYLAMRRRMSTSE
ncbi:MAG TPA: glycosyltransferase family 2 protein [Dermatophilaceae bacterium]|nr:glycosyltransferase family 2 protein [Dermatophilaceae bacterium]